ncbi:MAG: heme biosynthesis HemY N-terminal domain-containing protein [Halioglobus sp.]
MRRLFVLILMALLLGVGIVAIIETDPGYVMLAYGNNTLESSLWVGLLLLMAVALAVFFALRLFYRLLSGQRTFFSWIETRQHGQAQRNTTRGLISYGEGNWAAARRQVMRGAHKNDAPLLNHLLAARASHQLGDADQAREFLDAAKDTQDDADVMVDITRAELQLDAGSPKQALSILQGLRASAGKYPKVLSLLHKACTALEDWDGLLTLLPELKRHKTLPVEEYQALETQVHQHRLVNASTGDAATTEILTATWQQVPSELKQDPDMVAAYAGQLIAVGDHESAEKIILKALKGGWDASLVRQFGFLEGDQAPRRLAKAESWLQNHPEDSELLLCLGRLSARDRLWGKARDYFESSYRLEKTPEICAELGRLLTCLGEPKVAAAYYRDGLLMAKNDLPDLPMPDNVKSGQVIPG